MVKAMNRIKVKKLRRAVSQKELAFFVGISPAHISMIINGIKRPSPEVAKRLCKLTGKKLEYWLFIKKVNRKRGELGKKVSTGKADKI